MWRFYARMILRVPKTLWDASEWWARLVEVALLAGILIPGLTDVVRDRLTANLYWITLASLIALFAFGFLRSNYEAFGATEKRALYAEQRASALEEAQPRLRFEEEPQLYPNETVPYLTPYTERTLVIPVHLWRITITNCQPNSRAENVRIRIVSSEPRLDVLPVDLHEMHDENPPFRQKRDIRYDESIYFDVISKQVDGDAIYLYRSDLADSYVYELSAQEVARILKKLYTGGIILTVKAIADPPSRAEKQRSYRVFIDKSGSFKMEWAPDYDELSI